jgi:hypothetical protein
MKTFVMLLAGVALGTAAPSFAHGNMAPQHGGVVQMSGETLFELVRAPRGVAIYVTEDDEPLASAAATGKLAVTAGGQTRNVALTPGPGNRFDAAGLKLPAGAKVAVQVVEKATQARLGTTFVVK